MITFSCKKISREELVRCSFNLNKTEYHVLMFLLGKDKLLTASLVSRSMKLDRTTVQKAVKNLVDKELARRMQNNIPGGGYTFLYVVNDKAKIKARMQKIIYRWYKSVEEAIGRL